MLPFYTSAVFLALCHAAIPHVAAVNLNELATPQNLGASSILDEGHAPPPSEGFTGADSAFVEDPTLPHDEEIFPALVANPGVERRDVPHARADPSTQTVQVTVTHYPGTTTVYGPKPTALLAAENLKGAPTSTATVVVTYTNYKGTTTLYGPNPTATAASKVALGDDLAAAPSTSAKPSKVKKLVSKVKKALIIAGVVIALLILLPILACCFCKFGLPCKRKRTRSLSLSGGPAPSAYRKLDEPAPGGDMQEVHGYNQAAPYQNYVPPYAPYNEPYGSRPSMSG
ncbi:hypothetical protein FA95DRAFT_1553612 [Auriscalpium vulgare]|uniref:Uncharacterized protein n=1 Tax=Auriscalpium vulgare TaxID=40419 RepID=A0ACB8S7X0_9AGAM|nr:hypothetical protein FA95DRAFT_1553612 [Auriscalpium vulgare]